MDDINRLVLLIGMFKGEHKELVDLSGEISKLQNRVDEIKHNLSLYAQKIRDLEYEIYGRSVFDGEVDDGE